MASDAMVRLKADASGNTGLSEVLADAVAGFATPEDAVRFLATRGFQVTAADLAEAAGDSPADDQGGTGEEMAGDGYGALMTFVRRN